MIAEISAAFGSLKAAKDIVQGLDAVRSGVAINDVKIALQGHILEANQGLFAAQESQSALTRKVAELEQEIVRLKDWEGEKQRYELKKYAPGALAYTLKPGVEGAEPQHHLCANCYQKGEKSILQATTEIQMRYRLHLCPSCKTKTPMGGEVGGQAPINEIPSEPPPAPPYDRLGELGD